MADSIYDLGKSSTTAPAAKEPVKRSKNRESLSSTELRQGHVKLSTMVERAFETLERAMDQADWNTAIRAAQIVLDRGGFGPKSTVDVNTTHMDLSNLTKEQLAERASMIAAKLRAARDAQNTIDATPVTAVTVRH